MAGAPAQRETLRELGIEPGTDHVPGMCVHRHARCALPSVSLRLGLSSL